MPLRFFDTRIVAVVLLSGTVALASSTTALPSAAAEHAMGQSTATGEQFTGQSTAADERMLLDPFAQATNGYRGCPEVSPPYLTPEQARTQAHVRSERGLRCAMEGKCEPGGAYKRDPQTNERIRALIAGDRRFADTSVWVTTSRKWVTLQGCVRSTAQRKALVALAKTEPNVEMVFDELTVGVARRR